MKESPIRVQLSRKKGWRLPPNTISVARPGRAGNPYSIDVYGRELSLKLFRDTARGFWNPGNLNGMDDDLAALTYEAHRAFRHRLGMHPVEYARTFIVGKNVACWCGLDEACHGDIWLEIANS